MKKIGIFYGSTTGTTASVAKKIAQHLGVSADDIHNVANTAPSAMGDYDVMLLGSSTWGAGDLQDDWYDFIDGADMLALKGKEIALFGCGDTSMSDTFCDSVGEIYEKMQRTGAKFIGKFNTKGYVFEKSKAVDADGMAYGLLVDMVNSPETADERIAEWCEKVKKEI